MKKAEDRETTDEKTGLANSSDVEASVQNLGEQIAGLPEEQRQSVLEAARKLQELTRVETTLTASYEGPLPLPQHLEEYDRIVPGAASRIVRMAERDQEIKATVLEGSVGNERLKTIGAILLGAGIVAIAGYATHLGEPAIAIPLGLAGLATVIFRWLIRKK